MSEDYEPSKRAQMWAEAIGGGIAGGFMLFVLLSLFPHLVAPAQSLLCSAVAP